MTEIEDMKPWKWPDDRWRNHELNDLRYGGKSIGPPVLGAVGKQVRNARIISVLQKMRHQSCWPSLAV